MADNTTSSGSAGLGLGLGDLLALFGSSNPVAGIGRAMAQFQHGVGEFLTAVENFNATMAQLNQAAARVNSLLDTVEEPVKAFVPQLTRTIKAADRMTELVPNQLGQIVDVFTEMSKRLAPLTQVAESAGSLFGFRPLAALRAGGGRPEPAPSPAATPTTKRGPSPRSASTNATSSSKAAPSTSSSAASKAPASKAAASKGATSKGSATKTSQPKAKAKAASAPKSRTASGANKRG
jgi:hypothetical protein